MANEVNEIHIYEFPEKTDNIDKSNDYMIIHDGALKKAKVNKLYEYFNQNYKIENMVNYFNSFLEGENRRFERKYNFLLKNENTGSTEDNNIEEKDHEFIDKCDKYNYESMSEKINILINSFNTDQNNLRELETKYNTMQNDILNATDLIKGFTKDYNSLLSFFNLSDSDLAELSQRNGNIITQFQELNSMRDSIINNESIIKSGNDYIADYIEEKKSEYIYNIENITIKDIQSEHFFILKELTTALNAGNLKIFIQNAANNIEQDINTEYDKIVSIIDYYHHLHDA